MTDTTSSASAQGGRTPLTVLAWVWVGVPFLYGVYSLVIKVPALFG